MAAMACIENNRKRNVPEWVALGCLSLKGMLAKEDAKGQQKCDKARVGALRVQFYAG